MILLEDKDLKEKRDIQKKLMILVAIPAMMLAVAGPASADDLFEV
jgi:hypothetical protein